ncbi:MAG: 4-hydroxy-tetrahydrodipicolinate reductase [candidate division WOR-3 bacterium]
MIKVLLCGAAGRMGREIIGAIEEMSDIRIIGGVEAGSNRFVHRKISNVKITDNLLEFVSDADCIVEFTTPQGTMGNLKKSLPFKKPYVIGTTGFSKDELAEIKNLASEFPILLSPNMSMGINLMSHLVREVVRVLSEYEIEIIETHHRGKKDAPSGTAKAFAEIIKEIRPSVKFTYGRSGIVGERGKEEVGISAVRGGDIVGEHRILFLGDGEFIELRHFATSRRCFAQGTIEAIRFIVKQKRGLYTMSDVISSLK